MGEWIRRCPPAKQMAGLGTLCLCWDDAHQGNAILTASSVLTWWRAMFYLSILTFSLLAVYLLYMWLHKRAVDRRKQLLSQSRAMGYELLRQRKWSEAVTALDRALALVQYEPPLAAELHFHKGYALEHMEQWERALREYAACRKSETDQQLHKYGPVAIFRQGYILAQLERWAEAEAELQHSIEEAMQYLMPKLRLNALRILLGIYQATYRYQEAVACAQEALHLAQQLSNESTQALVLDITGDIYLTLGQPESALRCYEQSLDLFRRLEQAQAGLVVKQDIGKLYQMQGEWDKALVWLRACLHESEHNQDIYSQAQICYEIACLHISKGDLDEAASFLQRSMALFRQARDQTGADRVGRTLMGLGLLVHRLATADQMTFRDIERGSAKSKREE